MDCPFLISSRPLTPSSSRSAQVASFEHLVTQTLTPLCLAWFFPFTSYPDSTFCHGRYSFRVTIEGKPDWKRGHVIRNVLYKFLTVQKLR